MSALELVRALTEYNEWANGHVLEKASELSEEELDRKLGASFESVRGNLAHTTVAQGLWLSRWTGERSGAVDLLREATSFRDLRKGFDASHAGMRAFVASLGEHDMDRVVRYRDTRGDEQQGVLWRMMAHVVNHGTHHRAETSLLLTMLGKPPRQLDYVFFEIERAGGGPRLA